MGLDGDLENGKCITQTVLEEIKKPLIDKSNESVTDQDGGSITMVLLSTFVAVCGSFEFGTCMGYSAPTQAGIREDLGLSLAEYSVFGSIVTIGAMIGAITSGPIADISGRKGAMRMSAIICLVGWIAVYFAQGALSLDIGRFCTGYGIGVLSYVVPVFIAEITPKNLRGGLTTVNQLMICTGVSVAFIVGTLINWRLLVLTGLIPCVILLVGLCFIPESPRWLVGVGLMVFQQFGGINGILFYASETFVAAGFSSGKLGTVAMGCVQIPITALGAMLMDKSGRRPLLMFSSTGTCLGCLLTGTSMFLKTHGMLPDWVPILALSGILLFLGSFSLGMGAVPWVMMSEIFPINIKGMAGSLVTLVNWFGSWAVSFTFNFLMSWSSSGTLFLYAGVCALTIVFVAKVVPETKGRTLEEIQADMNNNS
ncbi:hypothetical protein H6P81_002005 [Aristolochia fimbriata]|uniref:Major facilitator superfamily (MFS) profile domain-containing protein n=1 Tax=Aristolochia fimbriata TaxID=158543 RepID=A0AAV7FBR8_ARIFI|nr:hypothetical protein H6P81_002005 [Aristolochia fimbriata]